MTRRHHMMDWNCGLHTGFSQEGLGCCLMAQVGDGYTVFWNGKILIVSQASHNNLFWLMPCVEARHETGCPDLIITDRGSQSSLFCCVYSSFVFWMQWDEQIVFCWHVKTRQVTLIYYRCTRCRPAIYSELVRSVAVKLNLPCAGRWASCRQQLSQGTGESGHGTQALEPLELIRLINFWI